MTPALTPTPLASLRVSRYHIAATQSFPNTSLRPYPLLVYHRAYPSSLTPSGVEAHLRQTGVVDPAWRFPMYKQHHYHSTTDEVLVVVAGSATLCFGGERAANTQRGVEPSSADHQQVPTGPVELEVEKGDVMVVPAGVGHAMISGEGNFEMVGSYPVGGEQWDMCTGDTGEGERKQAWKRIAGLKWFERDPVYGDQGPVLNLA
ncbi:hypothetical protein IAU60_002565 [Kwoniella sp. DSM 27419]